MTYVAHCTLLSGCYVPWCVWIHTLILSGLESEFTVHTYKMVCAYLQHGHPVPKWVKIWWATTNSIRVNFQPKYLNCVVVALIELEIWFPEDICYHNYITKLVKIAMWTLSKMWSHWFGEWSFPIHLLPWIIGSSIRLMCDFRIYAYTHTHSHTHTRIFAAVPRTKL